MFLEKIRLLLKNRQFISLATCDAAGQPNSAPQFIFKIKGRYLYLIDYTIGRTAANLRANPRASMSVMDIDNLEGYRLNGSVQLIERGRVYEEILKEFNKKMLKLSSDRFLEGVRTGKKTEHFHIEISDKFIVYKVKLSEAVKIGRQGDLLKESS